MDDIAVDHNVRGAYNEHSRWCFHHGTSFRRCAICTASRKVVNANRCGHSSRDSHVLGMYALAATSRR